MHEQTQTSQSTEEILFGDREARWYQVASLHAVEDSLEKGLTRILIEQPTGCGKTFTSGLVFSSDRVRAALGIKPDEKLRLLFVAHKHRLLTQAEREYAEAAGIELITQSAFSDIPDDVIKKGWHIACLDECQHEAMMTIQYQLEILGTRPIIGLTATPDRADGSLIKFEKIIAPISREQAVREGWLAETFLYTFVDTPKRDKTDIIKDILKSYHYEMGQTMVFVKTRAEVGRITQFIKDELRYETVGVLNQSERELNQILDDFSEGKIQFVVNCNKINEGVDVKNCQSVVLGRQYGSYPQLNQVIGRASRPDSVCRVWELINPLSGRNLDTTAVVGVPIRHILRHNVNGEWNELEFDYTSGRGHTSEIAF